jgi:glycerol uptake facilitator-like aquaporin
MTLAVPPMPATCFFEQDPNLSLPRRAMAEGVGTLLLMAAVTASGLNAQRLFSDQSGLGLLASADVVAATLVSLIVAFGSVSGGHFNPLITGLQWLAGQRSLGCTLAYIAAQMGGAVLGSLLASYVLGTNSPPTATMVASWRFVLSEVIASAGLMIVVFGCARSGRAETGPFAVGLWLAGAIVVMPSGSLANPAVVLGALVSRGAIAMSAHTAFLYAPAEIVGALLASLIVANVYPLPSPQLHGSRAAGNELTEHRP